MSGSVSSSGGWGALKSFPRWKESTSISSSSTSREMAGKKSDAEVAAVLSKISKSHLECIICHERYHEPKILDCLHNFCEKCLVTYQESSGDPSFIKCPVCRQKMKFAPGMDIVASLKTNFHIVSMVEDFTLQEQLTQPKAAKVICELCADQQEAQSRCMDCQFFICTSCKAIHQRISGMAGHDIVALDALRSGAVSLRSKAQDEPPCEKHRGEKKRFYCLTCNLLICRDCTVVEHRDPTHKFTTVDEATVRFRKNTKELIQKFEENLKAYEEASTELTETNKDLEKNMVLARQLVTDYATEERSKIAKREANFSIDIAKRQSLQMKLLLRVGIKINKFLSPGETKPEELPPVKDENEQKYSKTIDENFASLDNFLASFGQAIDSIEGLKSTLTSAAAKHINDDKSKVATSLDNFLKFIQDTLQLRKSTIKEVGKMMSAEIQHMRQTLETASDVVKTGSNVDFLNLHPVVDSYFRVLLVQSPPRLPLGYSKIIFKRSDDTELGELILGATWKFARQIDTSTSLRNLAVFLDAVLVSSSNGQDYVFHAASGSLQLSSSSPIPIEYGQYLGQTRQHVQDGQDYVLHAASRSLQQSSRSPSTTGGLPGIPPLYNQRSWGKKKSVLGGGLVATFPDNSFTVIRKTSGNVYPQHSFSCLRQYTIPTSIEQDGSNINLCDPVNVAHYRNQEIAISYFNWQGIIILDTSNASTVRKIPVDIKPDFLACTGRGRILVASKKPARVECLDGNDASSLTIHPTVAGSTDDGKEVICSGLCRDSLDVIYIAVSIEGANEIHIHQYTSHGSFIGCLTSGNISHPIIDIGVTGNGTLVVAEHNKLKLFETGK